MVTVSSSIQIRPARATDLPGLEWEGVYTKYRQVFRRTFEDVLANHRLMLVAAAGERLVGQVFVQLNSADRRFADGVNRAYLYSLRVRPEYQRQGIGTRLIETAETTLHGRGFRSVVIAVGKQNGDALRLYQRLGYQVFTEDPGIWEYIDDEGKQQRVEEPSWLLVKVLR